MNPTFLHKKLFFALIASAFVFTNCSDKRVDPELNSYTSMNDYFNQKKQDEQDFVIDTGGTCPVTGNQGTRVCPIKASIQYSNGDTVAFPFNMHLIELYTPKDLIYYQLSTVSGTSLVNQVGVISLRATKDGNDLQMTSSGYWDVEMPNASPSGSKNILYGSNGFDWATATSPETYTNTGYGYDGDVTSLSWITAGNTVASGATTKYTFTSTVDNLDNVAIFIYFPNQSSLVQVSNKESIDIPSGETVKIICMGMQGSKIFHYYKTETSGNSTTVDVTMTEISDGDLTTLLDGL